MTTKHVGRYLRAELIKPLGVKMSDLAHELDISTSLLRKVLAGERVVTLELAKRLELVLGIGARELLLMQLEYQLDNLSEDDYVRFKRLGDKQNRIEIH